jgi:hypothetical protein
MIQVRTVEQATEVKVSPTFKYALQLRMADDAQDLEVEVLEVRPRLSLRVSVSPASFSLPPPLQARETALTTDSGSPQEETEA